MGRPGLSHHPKFLMLARELGEIVARGALEMLWEVAYESGDDRLGSPDAVEAAARWRGERGALFAALRDATGQGKVGFIEERDGIWCVHDLWDHAPDYVRKRASREEQRRVKGQSLAAERRAKVGQRPGSDQAVSPTRAPAPARAPSTQEETSSAVAVASVSGDPQTYKAQEAPLQPLRLEAVSAKKPPRARSEALQYFDAFQGLRQKRLGLVLEADPPPAQVNAWFARAIGMAGLQRLQAAAYKFIAEPVDDYWTKRGCPFAGFMSDSVWRKYVPPEEKMG